MSTSSSRLGTLFLLLLGRLPATSGVGITRVMGRVDPIGLP